eukprot:5422194-Amphidinium_carterae.1
MTRYTQVDSPSSVCKLFDLCPSRFCEAYLEPCTYQIPAHLRDSPNRWAPRAIESVQGQGKTDVSPKACQASGGRQTKGSNKVPSSRQGRQGFTLTCSERALRKNELTNGNYDLQSQLEFDSSQLMFQLQTISQSGTSAQDAKAAEQQ